MELTPRRLAGVLIGFAMIVAACGGSGGSKTPSSTPPDAPTGLTPRATVTTTPAPPTTVTVVAAPATATNVPATGAAVTPAAAVDGTSAPPPPPPAATSAHPACGTTKPHAPGDSNETITSGGIDRTYILHVPPQYDGTTQMPLVLNLHGFGSNGRQQAIYSQLPAKGDREGFIVVSPDGTGEPKHWNYPGFGGADDVAFTRDLLDRVEADLCIDPKWVFAAGMSNGAAMTTLIACAMPDRITAVAPVAAMAGARSCVTDRPIPIITFRGTDDPCVPFEGGTAKCGMALPVVAAEDAAKGWSDHNGCNVEAARTDYTNNTRTVAYSECRGDAAVIMFVIEGGGHTWPGSIDVPRLGATTHEINATDQIWQFFVAQASLR